MRRSTQELLREALVHLELVSEYARGEDLDSQLAIDAICMRLSAGIARGYLLVDSGIVRQSIEIDLPDIVQPVNQIRAPGFV